MIDYTTLKHQADGTPTWDAFLGVILKVAVERQKVDYRMKLATQLVVNKKRHSA
ncbi:hypothetical protein [Limosilactobacillus reuteri]|uniref:hypothetical protein n=1 Tax=Limosilactobacillus reuteri TaxID=1598 RepID=UPI0017845F56|nr:hypothetical protein [Limosilactobacillus reuteri]